MKVTIILIIIYNMNNILFLYNHFFPFNYKEPYTNCVAGQIAY